jgi:hypothetical protein
MLLDRYLRSLDFGDLSKPAGRVSEAAGRPTAAESLAATPGGSVTDAVGDGVSAPSLPVKGGGLEWGLTVTAPEESTWSMTLTARGAGSQAPIQMAEAVAVRVLAEFGINVHGWEVQGWEPGGPTRPGPTPAGASPGSFAVLAPSAARPSTNDPAPEGDSVAS